MLLGKSPRQRQSRARSAVLEGCGLSEQGIHPVEPLLNDSHPFRALNKAPMLQEKKQTDHTLQLKYVRRAKFRLHRRPIPGFNYMALLTLFSLKRLITTYSKQLLR